MRLRAKPDANQKEIIEKLRKCRDISVRSIHSLGDGIPDILVGYRRKNFIFEIKNTEYSGKLTSLEQKFKDEWHGQLAKVFSEKEILEAIGYVV